MLKSWIEPVIYFSEEVELLWLLQWLNLLGLGGQYRPLMDIFIQSLCSQVFWVPIEYHLKLVHLELAHGRFLR